MATGESLKNRFKKLTIRWALFGVLSSLVLVALSASHSIKYTSEEQVKLKANALSLAFRKDILESNIRFIAPQMEEAAQLAHGESVEVLDATYQPILKSGFGTNHPSHCPTPGIPCWFENGKIVSVLIPIYFDENPKAIFGYLSVKSHPTVDWITILSSTLGIVFIFVFLIVGIYTDQKKVLATITTVLRDWKDHIDDPKQYRSSGKKLFLPSELLLVDESFQSLHTYIEQLESNAATKAKITVVRGVVHDIKTPLSQLAKYFDLFVNRIRESGKTINEDEVDRILGVMKKMGNLIRQVKDLDRKASADTRVNLAQWVDEHCKGLNLDDDVIASGIKIEYSQSGKQDIFANINPTDLDRLVSNLTKNAIEAMPFGRTEGNSIKIFLEDLRGSATISIKDNGTGIPSEIQDKIFELDFTTKKTKGTGLGLGIAKQICNDLNLELTFKSTEAKGTTFSVTFPCSEKQNSMTPMIEAEL